MLFYCVGGLFFVLKQKISPFLERFLSGWQDSNLRPPGPKPGAMTGLRYTPRNKSGETGTRTLAAVTRRQISNLLRYHSGTSPKNFYVKELIPFLRLQM